MKKKKGWKRTYKVNVEVLNLAIDMKGLRKADGRLKMTELSSATGVSSACIRSCLKNGEITRTRGENLRTYFNIPTDQFWAKVELKENEPTNDILSLKFEDDSIGSMEFLCGSILEDASSVIETIILLTDYVRYVEREGGITLADYKKDNPEEYAWLMDQFRENREGVGVQ